jgi:hypothetical protein
MRLRFAGLVHQSGREAFDYGPKMVQNPVRIQTQAAYPEPRHERQLVRTMVDAPRRYVLDGGTLPSTCLRPSLRVLAAAQDIIDRLLGPWTHGRLA